VALDLLVGEQREWRLLLAGDMARRSER